MKHKHHIIPKHAGGSNDPSNLIELTIEEHAEAHRILWQQYGRWQDETAWKMLSGQIGLEKLQEIKSYRGGLKTPKKKVAMYDNEGFLIRVYESVKSAAKDNNVWPEHVSQITNQKSQRKTHNGLRFRFYDVEPLQKIEKCVHKLSKRVGMFDKQNNLIEVFDSTVEASKKTNIPQQNIGQCALGKIKSCGGYIWRYENANLCF
jgi:hypothetical protein